MSNNYFAFKQFTIYHDKCAMKVGTDGVLIGAWTAVTGAQQILDIGTGTGLIALMLAQRSKAKITGVDIDKDAISQAIENIKHSPWHDRVRICHEDINSFVSSIKFDVIVSNPPFFKNALKGNDSKRNIARHTDTLSFESLVCNVVKLLNPNGVFSVIIPASEAANLIGCAVENCLYLSRKTWVKDSPTSMIKRCMLAFCSVPATCVEEDVLILHSDSKSFTPEYRTLVQDFYVNL